MAMYDWNKDGKNDFRDNYIEHEIFEQSIKDSQNSYGGRGRGGGVSTFGAIVGTILSMLISAGIVVAIGLEDSAVVVFIILMAIIGGFVAVIFEKIGL